MAKSLWIGWDLVGFFADWGKLDLDSCSINSDRI